MTKRTYKSRRAVLKVVGISGGIALGAGTVTARGGRPEAEPTFFARLSDNPSVPGHEKTNSRGKGRLDLTGGENGPMKFELAVRNLEEPASVVRIRDVGGNPLVILYPRDSSDLKDGGITGEIQDGDVNSGVLSDLIWNVLLEGDGVVDVLTDSGTPSEIAGVIRARPVNGWIAV